MANTTPHIKALPKDELEDQLEAALEQTFPASDAVTVGEPTADEAERPADRRPALIDKDLVAMLAKEVADKRRSLKKGA
jgi:hypothetical protein